jgi:YesN/AraC family two-component response regulator
MYNVLIVDDEELICLGIKSIIDRLGIWDIAEVFTACDALTAEKTADENKTNIVITDIKMPGINGLEFIRNLKYKKPNCRFIVLSGYDEFDLAREALKLGVLDYIIKPAQVDTIKNVLVAAIESIKKQEALEKEQENQFQQKNNACLENVLNRLFSSAFGSAYDQSPTGLGIIEDVFRLPSFCIGLMSFKEKVGGCKVEGIVEHARTVFRSSSTMNGCVGFIFINLKRELVIVFNMPFGEDYSRARDFLSALSHAFKVEIDFDCTLSISDIQQGITCLAGLYEQAREAISYQLLKPSCRIFEYRMYCDKENGQEELTAYINRVSNGVNNLGGRRTTDWIDSIFSYEALGNKSIRFVRCLFEKVELGLMKMVTDGIPERTRYQAVTFNQFMNLNEIRVYLKKLFLYANETAITVSRSKTLIQRTIKLILENYHRDITLSMVANEVSMNYTYFSAFFKEQTGMNFSQYLIKVRMEAAERMLNDPTNRVFEISRKVGYDNPKHFTRAFRNYFGTSPNEFRSSR